jgi:hypothetical protein
VKKWSKLIAVVVVIFGLVNVEVGAAFVGIGFSSPTSRSRRGSSWTRWAKLSGQGT